ncbi:MAG TPA: chorismate mutase [Thermoanaerobaculia bacterium]
MREPAKADAALAELREKIDRLNRDILKLLQRRAEVVLEIAELKRERGLARYDPRREEEMLQALEGAAAGPFDDSEVAEVFRAIFRASLWLQVRNRELAACLDRRSGT